MTPEDYYEAFTLGNYHDFMDNPSSVMRAFNVAVSASHLADCYYNFHKKNTPNLISGYRSLTDFLIDISEKTNNYFNDIRSISNAYKHLYTGIDGGANYSSISSAGTIESIIFEDEEINQVSEELLDKNGSDFTVIYTRKTGEQIRFSEAIETVINFWEAMIYKTEKTK